jgi:hypothetical protein
VRETPYINTYRYPAVPKQGMFTKTVSSVMSSLAEVNLLHFSSRKRHKAKNDTDRQYKKSWSNIPLRAALRKIEREPSSSPGKRLHETVQKRCVSYTASVVG